MPLYLYRALAPTGRVTKGEMTAPTIAELARALSHIQAELIDAREKKTRAFFPALNRPTAATPLPLFCRQIEDLLRAGLPLAEALRQIAATLAPGSFRDAILAVHHALLQGQSLSRAFAEAPRLFSPPFIASLRAGESSGDLVRCFASLAEDLAWQAELKRKMRKALRYPLFLLLLALGVAGFMATTVVPQIVAFLTSFGAQLPPSTRLLIALAKGAESAGLYALVGLALAALALPALARANEKAARTLDAWLLRLPLLGALLRAVAEARFVRTLIVLLESGLTLPESLAIAEPALANRVLQTKIAEGTKQLSKGAPLSTALSALFPPFARQVLCVGEASGRLIPALCDVRRIYDRQIDETAERLIGALEPALTLFVGGLLAWVVLAVLGPVYGTLNQLSMGGP